MGGGKRARLLGTFAVAPTHAAHGASSLHPLFPLTTVLHHGVIEANGTVPVRLVHDHRVIDGMEAARFSTELVGLLEAPERLFLEG